MGRRISRLTLRCTLLGLIAVTPVQATAVFDAASCARMGEMLSNGAQQLSKLQGLSSELQSLNAVMGNHLPASVSGALGQIGGLGGEFADLLSGISSPYADSLSTANAFSSQHGAPDFSKFIIAKNFIKEKLFVEDRGEGYEPLSVEKHDKIRSERSHVVKESSINGMALASQQKNTVKKAHEHVEDLGRQAVQSPSIHDDIRTTNQLLTLIATELIQQRALIAQQLELIASVVAEQRPLVFKSTALARPSAQSPGPPSPPWGQ